MSEPITPKILIVEDEMVIAADISLQFTKLGYHVIGINTRAEDALKTIETNRPDIVLMDITLAGEMDGITAASLIRKDHDIPVIFLSSNTDSNTFRRAVDSQPYGFIAKPFKKTDLQRGIEFALDRIAAERNSGHSLTPSHESLTDEQLYVRQDDKLIKVMTKNIVVVKANRNYSTLITTKKTYELTVPLKSIAAKLSDSKFVRTHRSFIVNLNKIDTISKRGDQLTIKDYVIPISRRLKENVLKQLKLI